MKGIRPKTGCLSHSSPPMCKDFNFPMGIIQDRFLILIYEASERNILPVADRPIDAAEWD